MYYGAKKTATLMNPVSYEYVTTGKELNKKVREEIQNMEESLRVKQK